jgi:hypothetical protein
MPRGACVTRNLFPLLLVVSVLMPFASASGPFVIGSANTVTADPYVTRPATTPCVVQLFNDAEFDNFNPYSFTYTPPADCPGPWAKVVFEADVNVTAGVQYDRTANFWLGATNIYFGTTAEPGSTLGPSWHVESDLTDYSSIFSISQQGTADIGNLVNSTYTGIIFASASLEFYPLAKGQPSPVTADVVLALSAGPTGGTVSLNATSNTLSGTFDFPLNVQAAYLDVYSQSQSNDEFWYTCSPNDVQTEVENECGNTGFRETEITIDGQPAGVAPVSPWIFTGGIDPFLWFPIPGAQTLNFIPYRVNLTPFAGLLSNGQQHTVSLSVYNADDYFSETASLLLYLDAGSTQVTGAVTQNTLTAAPSPVVKENLNVQSAFIKGTVDVSSKRNFVISGYVNTSHGKVTTEVWQNINFFNNQFYNLTDTLYVQNVSLGTSVWSTTNTWRSGGAGNTVTNQWFDFPLTLNSSEVVLPSGNINVITSAQQSYQSSVGTLQQNRPVYFSSVSNSGQHKDTLEFDSSFNFLGNTDQSSAQQYVGFDSTNRPYFCAISAAANVLTFFSPGCAQ